MGSIVFGSAGSRSKGGRPPLLWLRVWGNPSASRRKDSIASLSPRTRAQRVRRLVVATTVIAAVLGGLIPIEQPALAAGPPPANDAFSAAMVFPNGALFSHLQLRDSTIEATDPVAEETNGTVWFRLPVSYAGSVFAIANAEEINGTRLFKGPSSATSPVGLVEIANGDPVAQGVTVWAMVTTAFSSSGAGLFTMRMYVVPDSDGDGIRDGDLNYVSEGDNCIAVVNPGQEDTDLGGRVGSDGYGDACEPLGAPANDRFPNAQTLVLDRTAQGTTRNATINQDPPTAPATADRHDPTDGSVSVWYRINLPRSGFQCVESPDDSVTVRSDLSTSTSTYISVNVPAGSTGPFRLIVRSKGCPNDRDADGVVSIEGPSDNCPDDYNPDQLDSDADTIGDVCEPFVESAPVNDDIGAATPITIGHRGPVGVAAQEVSGSTVGATEDHGVGPQSVWYRFTAPVSTFYEFELSAPGGVTLSVMRADGTTYVARESSSRLATLGTFVYPFPAFAGEDIRVAVVSPSSANFTLKGYQAFFGNDRASATVLAIDGTSVVSRGYTTHDATVESGEAAVAGVGPNRTVWQRVQFESAGTVTVNYATHTLNLPAGTVTPNSNAGLRMAMYDGATLSGSAPSGSALTTTVQRCRFYDVVFDSDAPAVFDAKFNFQPGGGLTSPCSFPTLSIADAQIVEGNSGTTNLAFTVSLLAPAATDVVFSALTVGGAGTASPGSDFTAVNTEFTILAGQLTTTVQVPIIGDSTFEPDETFQVYISSRSAVVDRDTAAGTITNDDDGSSFADVSVVEGNTGTTNIDFSLTVPPHTGTGTVRARTIASGTNQATIDVDYTSLDSVVTFGPTETAKTIRVLIIGDTTTEANETFALELSDANGLVLGDTVAVGTILNDDGSSLSLIDPTDPTAIRANVAEPDGVANGTSVRNVRLVVRLNPPSNNPVTVNIDAIGQNPPSNPANGTAQVPGDAAVSPAALSFAPGETEKEMLVSVVGDNDPERNEEFFVRITSQSIGIPGGELRYPFTIIDNDNPPNAVDDTLDVLQGSTAGATVNVAANDYDPIARPLVFSVLSQGAKGTASCTPTGVCTYIPQPNATGTDNFTYQAATASGQSDSATVAVSILPLSQAVITITSGPADGSTTLQPTVQFGFDVTPSIVPTECSLDGAEFTGCSSPYVSPTLTTGSHTVSIRVVGGAVSTSRTFFIGGNRPPIASEDTYVITSGGQLLRVLDNDSDPDLNTLAVSNVVRNATSGELECGPTTCTYTPLPSRPMSHRRRSGTRRRFEAPLRSMSS